MKNEFMKELTDEERERRKEYMREWRRTHHEQVLRRHREWVARNIESVRAYQRAYQGPYYYAHRDKKLEICRIYAKKKWQKTKEKNAAWRDYIQMQKRVVKTQEERLQWGWDMQQQRIKLLKMTGAWTSGKNIQDDTPQKRCTSWTWHGMRWRVLKV